MAMTTLSSAPILPASADDYEVRIIVEGQVDTFRDMVRLFSFLADVEDFYIQVMSRHPSHEVTREIKSAYAIECYRQSPLEVITDYNLHYLPMAWFALKSAKVLQDIIKDYPSSKEGYAELREDLQKWLAKIDGVEDEWISILTDTAFEAVSAYLEAAEGGGRYLLDTLERIRSKAEEYAITLLVEDLTTT